MACLGLLCANASQLYLMIFARCLRSIEFLPYAAHTSAKRSCWRNYEQWKRNKNLQRSIIAKNLREFCVPLGEIGPATRECSVSNSYVYDEHLEKCLFSGEIEIVRRISSIIWVIWNWYIFSGHYRVKNTLNESNRRTTKDLLENVTNIKRNRNNPVLLLRICM